LKTYDKQLRLKKLVGTPTGLLQHSGLPFVYFARTFDAEPSGSELLRVYNELYDAARKAVVRYIASHPGHLALHSTDEGDSAISYNLAMTTAGMVILPRRAEGTMLRADGTDIGFVALNGTTLAGTMMVKHQEEWDVLRSRPGALDEILAAIGIPRESSTEKPCA
jgi:ATP adenylyltransferase